MSRLKIIFIKNVFKRCSLSPHADKGGGVMPKEYEIVCYNGEFLRKLSTHWKFLKLMG